MSLTVIKNLFTTLTMTHETKFELKICFTCANKRAQITILVEMAKVYTFDKKISDKIKKKIEKNNRIVFN